MLSRYLIIILFSTLCTAPVRSQDISQTMGIADHLFALQQYGSATKYYHRVAFFGGDTFQAGVFPKLAASYFQHGDYANSIFYYDLSSNTAPNDSLANEYLFARVLCYYMLGQYDYALQNLYSIGVNESDYFNDRYHFYHAIISMKKGNTDEALSHFLLLCGDSITKVEMEATFRNAKLNRPHPRVAKYLSILLPGSGQLYAGDYRNALNSFLLNGSFAALTFIIAFNLTPLDAILSTVPWFQRYYMGGFTRAELIALNRRTEKKEQLLDAALLLIEKHR